MHGIAPRGPEVEHDRLPAKRRELQLAVLVEALEREVGRRRALAARGRRGESAALVVDERPGEQDEEQHDEPHGHALGDEQQRGAARSTEMMNTGVPIFTRWNSHSASGMRMRMHPCEAEYPIEAASGVPWIPTYGTERPIQRVPSGLPGPGRNRLRVRRPRRRRRIPPRVALHVRDLEVAGRRRVRRLTGRDSEPADELLLRRTGGAVRVCEG